MTPPQAERIPDLDQPIDNTLGGLAQQYIRGRIARREIVNGTARAQMTVLRGFAASFGNRQLSMLGRHDILRYQESIAKLSVGTRRNRISVVRSFIEWLQLERRIKSDPMIGVRLPAPPRRVPRSLTDDEVAALWAVLPDARARAIVALALGMGLRRVEILRAQMSDWDPRKQTLRVIGKGGHERLLPVPDHVTAMLHAYCADIIHGPMIRRLDGLAGISNCYLGALVRAWMEDAGIKKAPFDGKACHSLRHTIATNVADSEPDLRVVQEMLGHSSLANTQIYTGRASIGKMRLAMNAVGPQVPDADVVHIDGGPAVCTATDAGRLAHDLEQALRAVATHYREPTLELAERIRSGERGEILERAGQICADADRIADRAELAVRNLARLTGEPLDRGLTDALWSTIIRVTGSAELGRALDDLVA